MEFHNTYEDQRRADAYDELELGGTYHLAFRDLPRLFDDHLRGRRALDFGCGTGRSTRFLQRHGFTTVGLDISAEMVALARTRDPAGEDYLAVFAEAGLEPLVVERPLATGDEGVRWRSETSVPPWAIYVLHAVSRSPSTLVP